MTIRRRSSEYNGMELVCAILFKYRDITGHYQLCDLLNKIIQNPSEYTHIKCNNEGDIKNYYDDIVKKNKLVDNYINGFKKAIDECKFNTTNISEVFISGKSNKHSEIRQLNKDVCKLDAKSDIYIKMTDETFIGISVKQSKEATKSNYSVHKMLGKETDQYLTKIKQNYLIENGFNEIKKEDMNKINSLFYPCNKNNAYMNALREEIQKNAFNLAEKLISHLYCSNVPYDVYEFNGVELYKLNNKVDLSNVSFEEHLPYYYGKKGKERSAAKLFYKLTCNEKSYRVEIRWKGEIKCSPQFQIHEE